jgi:rhamnulokinase
MTVMQSLCYLAIDLGAESGRAMLGEFDGRRLQLSEAHRFPNTPVRLPDGMHWDVLRLWAEIKQGLALAVRKQGRPPASIGLDTWGVDFGLFDRQGALLGNPYHYRDNRTDGMVERAFERMPREAFFERTGIQFMPINTVFQLYAMVVNRSPALEAADTFLMMPDLFNYWLTGQKAVEFSIATTSQCYDPRECAWSDPVLAALGIPRRIFPPIIQPGTVLGALLPEVAEETGAGGLPVITPACHDTGSAVAAVPAQGQDFAWLSSGTWSVMGAEVRAPVINPASLRFNFTNEGGVNGTFRFSRNIAGLWLVQECRRTWAAQGQELSYAALTELAAGAPPFVSLVDPDVPEFSKPGDMPARLRAYCRRTGQPVPESQAAIVRCALESLALKYRWVLEKLEEIVGHRLDPLHIVGGGTQNRLLNQFAADAVGRAVIAGPVEATAMGNILMQAVALHHIGSLAEGRRVVGDSFEQTPYAPQHRAAWDAAYPRFVALLEKQIS